MKKVFLKYFFLTMTVLWILFIFSNSLETGADSSEKSTTVSEVFADAVNVFCDIFGLDNVEAGETLHYLVRKAGHFTEFGILSYLEYATLLSFEIKLKNIWKISLPVCLLVASADESIQIFVSGRGPSVTDVLIDFSGALFFFLICLSVTLLVRKRKAGKEV